TAALSTYARTGLVRFTCRRQHVVPVAVCQRIITAIGGAYNSRGPLYGTHAYPRAPKSGPPPGKSSGLCTTWTAWRRWEGRWGRGLQGTGIESGPFVGAGFRAGPDPGRSGKAALEAGECWSERFSTG